MMKAHIYGDLLAASFGSAGFMLYDARDAQGGLAVLTGGRAPTVFRIDVNAAPAQTTASLAGAGAPFESRVLTLAIAAGLATEPRSAGSGTGLRKMSGGGFFGRRASGSAEAAPAGAAAIKPDVAFREIARPRVVRLGVEETLDLLVEGGRGLVQRMKEMASRAPIQFKPVDWLVETGLLTMLRPLDAFDRNLARNALRASPDAPLEAWLWCGAPPTREEISHAGPDADAGRLSLDRIQATNAQPLLAGLIASDPIFSAAVDARRSLANEITTRFGLAPASLKRLGKITAAGDRLPEPGEAAMQLRGEDALGIDRIRIRFAGGAITMPDCLDVLKDLPPDWTPATNEDWGAFTRVMSAALPLVNLYALTPMEAFGTSKGKWVDYEKTLRKAAGYAVDPADSAQARRALALAFADAMECVHVMAVDTLLTPAVRNAFATGFDAEPSSYYVETAHRKALDMTLGSSGVVGLLESSRRWVGQMTRLAGRDGAIAALPAQTLQEPGTPQAFAPFVASNGLVVRHLLTEARIELESTRLGHCVGQKGMPYRKGNKKSSLHIVSITSQDDDESFSTVEIDPLIPGAALRVRQHQGRVSSNRVPTVQATAAWNEFAAAFNRGEIAAARDQIATAAAAWREFDERMGRTQAEANRETPAMQRWRAYLGDRVIKKPAESMERDAFFVEVWSHIVKRRPEDFARAAQALGDVIRPVTLSERIASFGEQEMRI